MIETRYLDFEGLKTKNELAGDLAENYDLTTYDNEFLDTDNDEEVESFLLYHCDHLDKWLSDGTVFKIEIEFDQNNNKQLFTNTLFEKNLSSVNQKHNEDFIHYLKHNYLINLLEFEVENEDEEGIAFKAIVFYEENSFSYYLFDESSELIGHNLSSIDEVNNTIKNHFESEGLDSNITLGLEEVQIKDSLELDMLKMSFIDQGFPKNHFLKTNGKYGSDFFTSKCEMVWHSTLSLDEVDVDLLSLLKRDSEPYHKPDEAVDLKQEEKATHRSRNRPR
ncbi:hypothetical protein Q6U54_002153 [Vibrio vulnificus]|nr:hypothetical protein [Vibrio vulnificus]